MAKSKFKFDVYEPEALQHHDKSELRSEYYTLRHRAQERLRQFEKAGATADNTTYWYYKRVLATTPGKVTDRELPYLLKDAYTMLTSKRGSIAGQRKIIEKSRQTLLSHGYKVGSWSDNRMRRFGSFMDWARSEGHDKEYGSDRLHDMYNGVDKSVDAVDMLEKFEEWDSEHDGYMLD